MAYVIHVEFCSVCGLCLDACPLRAIVREGDSYSIDPEICTECGYCSDICPEYAVRGE